MDFSYRICAPLVASQRAAFKWNSRTLWAFILLYSLVLNLVGCSAVKNNPRAAKLLEDDEFAEFEEFDEDVVPAESTKGASKAQDSGGAEDKTSPTKKPPPTGDGGSQSGTVKQAASRQMENDADELDGVVENEIDDDFEQLSDDAEFQVFDQPAGKSARKSASKLSQGKSNDDDIKQLKFTDVPAHLRNNWSNFQVELLMLFGLLVYLANYVLGKSKNHRLATTWFESHRELLQSNFEVVGDDGTTQEVQKNILMKESDNLYSLWCTGRQACQGAFVQLRFLKRQDIISLIMQIFKPQYDKILIRFNLNQDDMDSCVLAFGNKKTVTKLAKDCTDLSQYCTEKKNSEKLGLPDNFCLFSEMAEAVNCVIDAKTLSIIQKYEDLIDYIHVSDQFSGLKSNEGEPQAKLPEISRTVIFCFNVPGKLNANEQSIDDCKPLLAFTFYCLEKIRRFRLSREAKQKCDKNRMTAQESYLKQTHAQRQEAAQVRREERVRERKERVLAEEDPEKQRRMEKSEQKKELKKKQPRVKQLKIKAG